MSQINPHNVRRSATGDTSGATKPAKPIETFKQTLALMEKRIAGVLPKHITPDRILKAAMVAAYKNNKLYQCTQLSMMNAIMTAAQLGLDPGGALGSAYLVPYDRKRKDANGTWVYSHTECQLIIGYQGMIDLARRSGEIESIAAIPVFDGDQFDMELGTEAKISHKPNVKAVRTVDTLVLVYVVAKFRGPDGAPAGFHVEWMSKAEIDAIRRRSKAADDGPWVTDPIEMARKTCVRRAFKYLPKSIELLAKLAEIEAEGTDAGALADIFDTTATPIEPEPAADAAPAQTETAQLPEPANVNPLPGVFKDAQEGRTEAAMQQQARPSRAAATAAKLNGNHGGPPA